MLLQGGHVDRPRPPGDNGKEGLWRMAQPKAKKSKRPAKRQSRAAKAPSKASSKASSGAKPKFEARIRSLEKERDRLKAQLEVAGARITGLEQGRDEVVNRIDWVIDSLQHMSETEA